MNGFRLLLQHCGSSRGVRCVVAVAVLVVLVSSCASSRVNIKRDPVVIVNGFQLLPTPRSALLLGMIHRTDDVETHTFLFDGWQPSKSDIDRHEEQFPMTYYSKQDTIRIGGLGVQYARTKGIVATLRSTTVERVELRQSAIDRHSARIDSLIQQMEQRYGGTFRLIRSVNVARNFDLRIGALGSTQLTADIARKAVNTLTGADRAGLEFEVYSSTVDSTYWTVSPTTPWTISYFDDMPRKRQAYLLAPVSVGMSSGRSQDACYGVGVGIAALGSSGGVFNPALKLECVRYGNGTLVPVSLENYFVGGRSNLALCLAADYALGAIDDVSDPTNGHGAGASIGLQWVRCKMPIGLSYRWQHSLAVRRDGSSADGFWFGQVTLTVQQAFRI